MDAQNCSEYSRDLGIELISLDLIQENKYCIIYLGRTRTGPCIIKKYKGEETELVSAEAEALSLYHRLARDDTALIDSGPPQLKRDKNLLWIGFVDGDPFNVVLYRAPKDKSLCRQCVQLMVTLGKTLRKLYEDTLRPGEQPSPFLFEYIEYASTRLQRLPVLGALAFRHAVAEARELSDALRSTAVDPSFVHGDLVFKNIHVRGERLGLIDFANANPLSHPLNDIYNLRFALANMLIPQSFKTELLYGFQEGLGDLSFPDAAHRFYYEYHRRRWLMLKLTSRNPSDVMQGFRGLATFAKPFREEVRAG
jgi:hypothetical protein